MTKIKILIDTDSAHIDGAKTRRKMVGLLSSIPLARELVDAFHTGLGEDAERREPAGYKHRDIKDKKDDLKRQNRVIATVGGRVVLEAIKDDPDTPPFVSLVADLPPGRLGSCRGGILLESYKRNKERKQSLKDVDAVHTDTSIYLLANPNSAMYGEEKSDWGNEPTHKDSYVADVGNRENDATKFAWDFFGDPADRIGHPPKTDGATAIIVSDDPYFQANRAELIRQGNLWLAQDRQRHIVYPSSMYENQGGEPPKAGQSTVIGADLISAYRLLGILADSLAADPSREIGFFSHSGGVSKRL